MYRLDDPWFESWQRKIIFYFTKTPRPAPWLTQALFTGYHSHFTVKNGLGRGADRWPSPSAEVKNEWSCTSAPSICLQGVGGDYVTSVIIGQYVT